MFDFAETRHLRSRMQTCYDASIEGGAASARQRWGLGALQWRFYVGTIVASCSISDAACFT